MEPLLTTKTNSALLSAWKRADAGPVRIECSLDLECSLTTVDVARSGWIWAGRQYPLPKVCKERTVYYWTGSDFQPVSRYTSALIKLVPTEWGPPVFEIDGIKMLPTAQVSPYADAARKVALIQPLGKTVLDTCGGLGYFASWCLQGGARRVLSFEKNPDVIWLRTLNPWSPQPNERLTLVEGDVYGRITELASRSVDAVLHDPPRFGIAGELYSQAFYDQLARVLKANGRLFHYTGTPNKLTSGRNVPQEVVARLRRAGFLAELNGDGVLARKKR